ncbi:MAG TPA: hypothetical protein VK524_34940 [Polyangiaceae bacterium]|nr:hypothetical protein [Polyangiaceae bacterium]
MSTLKKVSLSIGVGVLLLVIGVAVYVTLQVLAYDASMNKTYATPLPSVVRSSDPAVLERGKHLVESVGGCTAQDCHGPDLAGGRTLEMGPIGTITGPNITPGAPAAAYSDGELARLIRHGIKRDGRSLRFMPAQDFAWLPESDIASLVSYWRTVESVEKPDGPLSIGLLAKVLDRRDQIVMDVARRIDHTKIKAPDAPTPTAEYGALLARACTGCHGDKLSGGRIPGAPSSLPTPTNLTPHETGLKSWKYADFERLLTKGARPNGTKLDPFMPIESLSKLNALEKQALWAYLRSLPPTPFGQR